MSRISIWAGSKGLWVSDVQEEDRGMDVCLGVPQSLDHEFALEVLGEPACVASDGVEKPIPLRLGEERCVFRVLETKNACQRIRAD